MSSSTPDSIPGLLQSAIMADLHWRTNHHRTKPVPAEPLIEAISPLNVGSGDVVENI